MQETGFIQGEHILITFFRKIIAENANRMIFADSFDNENEKILPRSVDSIQYKKEQAELKKWHDLNKQSELEYYK